MEKGKQLYSLDQKLISYFQRHNYAKKQRIDAFSIRKEDVKNFYKAMKDYFYQNQYQKKASTQKKSRFHHHSASKYQQFTNPISFSLPKKIQQRNTIAIISIEQMKGLGAAMYSQVQTNKQMLKYLISNKVKCEIIQDIKKMQFQRQQRQNNTHNKTVNPYNNKLKRTKSLAQTYSSLQEIQKLNKILIKFNQKFIRAEEDNHCNAEESTDNTINLKCISLFENLMREKMEKCKRQQEEEDEESYQCFDKLFSNNQDMEQYLSQFLQHGSKISGCVQGRRGMNRSSNTKSNMDQVDEAKTVRRNRSKQLSINVNKLNPNPNQNQSSHNTHFDANSQIFITNNQRDKQSIGFKTTANSFLKTTLSKRRLRIQSAGINNHLKSIHKQPAKKHQFKVIRHKSSTSFHKKLIYNPIALKNTFNLLNHHQANHNANTHANAQQKHTYPQQHLRNINFKQSRSNKSMLALDNLKKRSEHSIKVIVPSRHNNNHNKQNKQNRQNRQRQRPGKYEEVMGQGLRFRTKTIVNSIKLKL